MKKNHMLLMILAGTVLLLLIFLLPVFGIKSDYTAFIAIAFMFVAHLFMMGGHGHDHGEEEKETTTKRGEKHEHH